MAVRRYRREYCRRCIPWNGLVALWPFTARYTFLCIWLLCIEAAYWVWSTFSIWSTQLGDQYTLSWQVVQMVRCVAVFGPLRAECIIRLAVTFHIALLAVTCETLDGLWEWGSVIVWEYEWWLSGQAADTDQAKTEDDQREPVKLAGTGQEDWTQHHGGRVAPLWGLLVEGAGVVAGVMVALMKLLCLPRY